MASEALVTKNLSRRFGQRWALADLSLKVEPGEVYGFLGPNGAGKTTAIRCILGLIRPTLIGGHHGRVDRVVGWRGSVMVETPAFHTF